MLSGFAGLSRTLRTEAASLGQRLGWAGGKPDRRDAARPTRLLGVGFHLVALGFLALVSTWDPFEIQGTVQYVVTKTGAILLFLGVLHVITLFVLARVRNNRRVQSVAASLRGGGRRPQRGPNDRTQALES